MPTYKPNKAQPATAASSSMPPPPPPPPQDKCWMCGKGSMVLKRQDPKRFRTVRGAPGLHPDTQFFCSFFPYCGGHRVGDKWRVPAVLQLRGEGLERLAVGFPEWTGPFDGNKVKAKMTQLKLAQFMLRDEAQRPLVQKVWAGACMDV
jgi:hypothetical protein